MKRIAGFDVSGSGVKIAVINKGFGGKTVVESLHYVPFIKDPFVGGKLSDIAASELTTDLKSVLAEHKIPRHIIVGFEGRGGVRAETALLPARDRGSMIASLKDEATRRRIAFNNQNEGAVLDYAPIRDAGKEDPNTGEPLMEALVVAVRNDFSELFIKAFQEAGFIVMGADISGIAQMRAMKNHTSQRDGVDLLVDIGETLTTIVFHDNGTPVSVSYTRAGNGAELTKIMMKAAPPHYAVESLHRMEENKLEGVHDVAWVNEVYEAYAKEAMLSAVDNILSMVENFTERNNKYQGVVSSVTICGGGSQYPQMHSALGGTFGVEVADAELNPAISFGKKLSAVPTDRSWYPAIGLAMGYR